MADLFVFGDSIGYGAWDEKGGWVDRLKQHFHTQKLNHPDAQGTEVYNLSVDGDKSGDVAARIKSELQVRRKSWSTIDDLVLVAIGTNDAYAEGKPDNFPISLNDYRQNLQSIYTDIRALKLRLVFITLDPVDESQTNPCPWGAYYWTNERIDAFNHVLKGFCRDNKIPLLDLHSQILSEPNFSDMLFDGAHPNSAGHKYMYEHIKPFILRLMESSHEGT